MFRVRQYGLNETYDSFFDTWQEAFEFSQTDGREQGFFCEISEVDHATS